jgi:alkylation response protein AidB-like acyl-CoA dehydrogenase
VDFSFDETQRAVAELAATVVGATEPDGARADAALRGPTGYDEALWKAMAQAGLLSLAVPRAHGGEGFGPIEVAAVLREVGRQIMPLPAYATLALGVLPVAAYGTTEQQAVLGEVADGRILTAALRGISGRRDGDALVLSGVARAVPYAAQAYRILLPTDIGTALVAPDAPGLTLTRTPTSTGSAEYALRCTEVRVAAHDVLAADAAALDRFAVAGAAAVADGVAAGALALTAEHLRTRHQFGKPLATFQAVAQQIADVYIVARTLNLSAWSAIWALAERADRSTADDDLDVAAYWLCAELPPALQCCHHLHGGLGVDISYPMHRYYSHAKDLARLVGGSAARLDRIGERCTSN